MPADSGSDADCACCGLCTSSFWAGLALGWAWLLVADANVHQSTLDLWPPVTIWAWLPVALGTVGLLFLARVPRHASHDPSLASLTPASAHTHTALLTSLAFVLGALLLGLFCARHMSDTLHDVEPEPVNADEYAAAAVVFAVFSLVLSYALCANSRFAPRFDA